ncbi:MAG: transcriptional regulator [Verrucomicrobia bacterium]|nr:MAG: transcriptional regulator [Verrucomicrobiota bacterium]PYL57160.1 MAG: transcriptional regulator [Verrucomicrobiota bacterium]
MSPHPGEVWLADLGLAAKTRPIVIVSRHDPEAPRALAIYVPLTTQNRGSKYEVVLPQLRFLRDASVANVRGLASLPLTRLERKVGDLPPEVLARIREVSHSPSILPEQHLTNKYGVGSWLWLLA